MAKTKGYTTPNDLQQEPCSNCKHLAAEKAELEQERDQLRTLAHTLDAEKADLERTSQEWHAHADAAEADNLVLEQRVRELSADLEFANLKTRRKKL